MSNIGSTALQTEKQKQTRQPNVPAAGPNQQAFNQGTMGMLNDARQVVENAVGQGQELNPMIYQMLGLDPQYEDNSAELQSAQTEMNTAQQQYDQAQKQLDQLKGVPKGQRTPAQRQQIRQLNKSMPALTKSLGDVKNQFNQLQTSAKSITGFNRLDPSKINAQSPFSAQNPLYQAQQTEAQRLNQYLQGGEVDPTLKHQYDQAEAQLKATLTQRYGPDFANSSVGQMALQNFARQKNEAFATWNQQQVQKYNDLAFQGQANLQSLLGGQIALMREPSTSQMNMGTQLTNDAQTRLQQQQLNNQLRLGKAGVTVNTTGTNPAGLIGAGASGLGQLLSTPVNGNTLGGAITRTNPGDYFGAAQPASVGVPSYGGSSALSNWATEGSGTGAFEATNAAGATTAGADALGGSSTVGSIFGF